MEDEIFDELYTQCQLPYTKALYLKRLLTNKGIDNYKSVEEAMDEIVSKLSTAAPDELRIYLGEDAVQDLDQNITDPRKRILAYLYPPGPTDDEWQLPPVAEPTQAHDDLVGFLLMIAFGMCFGFLAGLAF